MLVVSEMRSQESRIREARKERTRGEERLVGCSDSGPAMGMAKENQLRQPMEWIAPDVGGRGFAREGKSVPPWDWLKGKLR